ncbi:hypothetical protein JCM8547_005549 [Rhodosporidiobolus lusitaniae]
MRNASYGKRYNNINMLPVTTSKCGIRYAIASVDIRGSGHSSGSVQIMVKKMGEDGHDVVEELAKKEWCSGKIGLAGNSLKAIAPWEGCGDLFREQFVRGGVFEISNMDLINKLMIKGKQGTEDSTTMCGSSFHLPSSSILPRD